MIKGNQFRSFIGEIGTALFSIGKVRYSRIEEIHWPVRKEHHRKRTFTGRIDPLTLEEYGIAYDAR
jgi:hypothetical protein